MARERTDMRKSREILRHILQLKLSYKVVEASLGVSHGLVCRTLTKVRERGLAWPEIEPLSHDELETLLARHHASQEESSDIQKSKTAWTLAQLRRQAPGLDWDAYLQAAGLGSLERFHIWHPRAMKGLAQAVRAVPLSTWRDYLAFHAVNQRADSLPRAMRQQHFEFYGKVLAGAQEPTPRWQVALGATNAALQDEIALAVSRDPAHAAGWATPSRTASRCRCARTSKNSSRLDDTMVR